MSSLSVFAPIIAGHCTKRQYCRYVMTLISQVLSSLFVSLFGAWRYIFVGTFSISQCITLYECGDVDIQSVPRSKHSVSVIKINLLT